MSTPCQTPLVRVNDKITYAFDTAARTRVKVKHYVSLGGVAAAQFAELCGRVPVQVSGQPEMWLRKTNERALWLRYVPHALAFTEQRTARIMVPVSWLMSMVKRLESDSPYIFPLIQDIVDHAPAKRPATSTRNSSAVSRILIFTTVLSLACWTAAMTVRIHQKLKKF